MSNYLLIHGDARRLVLPNDSVDAVVVDPPAGIAFMGKEWDTFSPSRLSDEARERQSEKFRPGLFRASAQGASHTAKGRHAFIAFLTAALAECLRIARPGAHLLCWAIPRTSHWTGTAIEDAGWLIENRIAHCFGTGYPKSKYQLKPAVEDWWLATKPGGEKWLGVEACRVDGSPETTRFDPSKHSHDGYRMTATGAETAERATQVGGRWPANLVLSHSPDCVPRGTKQVKGGNGISGKNSLGLMNDDGWKPHREGLVVGYADPDGLETVADWDCAPGCPIRLLGEQSGECKSGGGNGRRSNGVLKYGGTNSRPSHDSHVVETTDSIGPNSGTAARFFPQFEADPFVYQAKASRADRNAGCEGMEERGEHRYADGDGFSGRTQGEDGEWVNTDHANRVPTANHHPTVKSTPLMRWLCRLACPTGGLILDSFMGSGSTGVAAVSEGFRFIGIEKDPQWLPIAARRLVHAERVAERPHAAVPRPRRAEPSMPLFAGQEEGGQP